VARVRREDIHLRVGHCSLEPSLGRYYQDITPALALVEGGYYGVRDASGVPKNRV